MINCTYFPFIGNFCLSEMKLYTVFIAVVEIIVMVTFAVEATGAEPPTKNATTTSSPPVTASQLPPLCPHNCRCTAGRYATWNCANSNLTSDQEIIDILKRAPKTLYKLSFKGNNLKTFPTKHLRQVPKLIILDLSNNFFVDIPNDVSAHAPELHALDLSHNNISTLNKSQIGGLYLLKKLHLPGNYITTLDDNVFWNCSTLFGLYLQNNQITTIVSQNSFKGLTSLTYLDLSQNRISSLQFQVLKFLTNLSKFSIADNELKTLLPLTFHNLQMDYAIFARNNIAQIQNQAFSKTIIEVLDLSWNRLESFRRDSLRVSSSVVESLDLTGNPVVCNCKLHELYQYIKDDVPDINGACASPVSATNHTITEIMKNITCTPCWNVVCPLDKVCEYDENGYTKCVCKKGKFGRSCGYKNPCFESVCENGATCTQTSSIDFKCICTQDFTGEMCNARKTDEVKTTTAAATLIPTTTSNNNISVTPIQRQKPQSHQLGVGWTVFIVFACIAVLIVASVAAISGYRRFCRSYRTPAREPLRESEISLHG